MPLLGAARDFLMDRTFRLVRHSFAHWSFDLEFVGQEFYLVAFDRERDLPYARLHRSETDAFHIGAFSLVEVLHDSVIVPASGK